MKSVGPNSVRPHSVWVRVTVGARVIVGVGLVRGYMHGKFGIRVTIRVRVGVALGLLLILG